MTTVTKEMKLTLTLRDPRAKEIVEAIPVKQRDEAIEKFIILGDMVVTHASISTSKETVEQFFEPLTQDIENIREQLRQIVPTVKTPSMKGKITVEAVYHSLREHFMDDSFEDVSRIGKYSDILATTAESKTPVLIELKDYDNTVPTIEVEKFWRDIELRGTRYGIFISMRTGITKCSSCITLKTEMNKTAVFVNNSELNWSGHIFAFYVIKKIAELESIKKKELKDEEVNKVIAKVNKHIQDLQKQVDSIEKIIEISEKLKTTAKNSLEDLISISNALKRNMNEKIKDVLSDLEGVTICE